MTRPYTIEERLMTIDKLGRIQRELLQDLGREPTPEELAKEMDITPEKVLAALRAQGGPR